jgi:hypothetical protein
MQARPQQNAPEKPLPEAPASIRVADLDGQVAEWLKASVSKTD